MYIDVLRFNIRWNWKNISLLAFLAVFPNVLGLLSVNAFGVKLHFFQYLIFLAALAYGPLGGAISGAFGSVWTAAALNNPYIIVGNMLLGFFVGLFVRMKWNVVIAVLAAYLIQLPWLWVTDVYLAHMPVKVVKGIVVALLVSDVLWAAIASLTSRPLRRLFVWQ